MTTAAPYQPEKGDQGPGAPYNSAAKFYTVYTDTTETDPDLRVSHIGIDRNHTTAEDMRTWFPLQQLKRVEGEGVIGGITERFYGADKPQSKRTMKSIVPKYTSEYVKTAALPSSSLTCHQTVEGL